MQGSLRHLTSLSCPDKTIIFNPISIVRPSKPNPSYPSKHLQWFYARDPHSRPLASEKNSTPFPAVHKLLPITLQVSPSTTESDKTNLRNARPNPQSTLHQTTIPSPTKSAVQANGETPASAIPKVPCTPNSTPEDTSAAPHVCAKQNQRQRAGAT